MTELWIKYLVIQRSVINHSLSRGWKVLWEKTALHLGLGGLKGGEEPSRKKGTMYEKKAWHFMGHFKWVSVIRKINVRTQNWGGDVSRSWRTQFTKKFDLYTNREPLEWLVYMHFFKIPVLKFGLLLRKYSLSLPCIYIPAPLTWALSCDLLWPKEYD